MKSIRLLCFVIITVICFSIFGCTTKEEWYKEGNKAQEIIIRFFGAVSERKFTQAEEYLHPHFLLVEKSLPDYIAVLERRENIDFSHTIKLEHTQNSTFTQYAQEFSFKRKSFSFEYIIFIGDIKKTCYITVVDNDDGYGIYRFTITE